MSDETIGEIHFESQRPVTVCSGCFAVAVNLRGPLFRRSKQLHEGRRSGRGIVTGQGSHRRLV